MQIYFIAWKNSWGAAGIELKLPLKTIYKVNDLPLN